MEKGLGDHAEKTHRLGMVIHTWNPKHSKMIWSLRLNQGASETDPVREDKKKLSQ